jgi:tetrahydromethanopterin S-methyltransferase subunit C
VKKNMGRIDRTLRLAAAAVFAVLLIAGVVKGTAAIVLAILAAIFVITTFVGFCPLYAPLGISTKESKKHDGPTHVDV